MTITIFYKRNRKFGIKGRGSGVLKMNDAYFFTPVFFTTISIKCSSRFRGN